MSIVLIFLWVWAAFIAMAFWESRVKGRNSWDKKKLGWKFRLGKYTVIPLIIFFLFWVMAPLFVSLPLVVFGWNLKLFGILVSAFFTGVVIEDFMWFVVNTVVKMKEFNPKWAGYYPWVGVWRLKVPLYYIITLGISFLSWYFIWG